MGDFPNINSEHGWAYNKYLAYIRIYHNTSVLYLYKNFKLKRGWAYNTCTYYTVLSK